MNIIGWEPIIPELAIFFAVLKRRPNHLTPFNLFLVGKPGTNKTEGIACLSTFLGHKTSFVDMSTLDDVTELAGVIDLNANMERGASSIIEGDLLVADVLVLDEFLNTRPHVLSQCRLMLQGHLVVYGKKQNMAARAIIGTGNLTEHMLEGAANQLDSPNADRFAMLVEVPSLENMSDDQVSAILEGRCDQSFDHALKNAVDGIDRHFDSVEREYGSAATRYVLSLARQMSSVKEFAFEGRRAKLLRLFVLGAMALCRAETERDLSQTIWAVAKSCLSYHKLSGRSLDVNSLRLAHEVAWQVIGDLSIDALIAEAPTLAAKIELVVKHIADVRNPATKADVFGDRLAESEDIALKIACQELMRTPQFRSQPAELRALVERIPLPRPDQGVKLDAERLEAFSRMTPMELVLFEICAGNISATNKLRHEVEGYLAAWGVLPSAQSAA